MRWGYFDPAGTCIAISTDRIPGHTAAHEHQVPDTYKPNTTRMNPVTMEIETFARPPIPPPQEQPGSFETRLRLLEERVKKLEDARTS